MAAPVLVGLHHLKLPVSHLDASIDWYARVLGAEHQPQFDHVDHNGTRGHLLVFADPDGTFLRLLEMPEGGIANIRMQEGNPEPDGPWVAPPSMRHPSTQEAAR
jgi:catechol 2,3-dioxygenase-like lactoylglutathione lyase family enzyme